MLETIPQDAFRTIYYQGLKIRDICVLMQVSSKLQQSIIQDGIIWEAECKIHFSYLVNKITQRGEPKSWYLAYRSSEIDEYELDNSKVGFFSVAKSGDAAMLEKLCQRELKGLETTYNSPSVAKILTRILEMRDKSGYFLAYWFWRKGYQNLLDDIFAKRGAYSTPSQVLLNFIILCRQEEHLRKNVKNFLTFKPSLLVTARLGSLSLIQLLFDNFAMRDAWEVAFVEAAACGCTDIVEFLHEKIAGVIKLGNTLYKSSMHQAFRDATVHGHKETIQTLLRVYDRKSFSINKVPANEMSADKGFDALLSYAILQADPIYVTMFLDAGASYALYNSKRPNLFDSAILRAVFIGNYVALVALLKNDAYENIKTPHFPRNRNNNLSVAYNNMRDSDCKKLKEWLEKKPLQGEPRMRALVDLMCYQYELEGEVSKNLFSDLAATFSNLFGKPDELKLCNILFNVLTRKCAAEVLDELNPNEKSVLSGTTGRLGNIYQNLLGEIQKIRKEEILVKAYSMRPT